LNKRGSKLHRNRKGLTRKLKQDLFAGEVQGGGDLMVLLELQIQPGPRYEAREGFVAGGHRNQPRKREINGCRSRPKRGMPDRNPWSNTEYSEKKTANHRQVNTEGEETLPLVTQKHRRTVLKVPKDSTFGLKREKRVCPQGPRRVRAGENLGANLWRKQV